METGSLRVFKIPLSFLPRLRVLHLSSLLHQFVFFSPTPDIPLLLVHLLSNRGQTASLRGSVSCLVIVLSEFNETHGKSSPRGLIKGICYYCWFHEDSINVFKKPILFLVLFSIPAHLLMVSSLLMALNTVYTSMNTKCISLPWIFPLNFRQVNIFTWVF